VQVGHRLAQARARHAQPLGQFAFGRQPLARPQDAAQDQLLDLPDHRQRQLLALDLLEGHGTSRIGPKYDHIGESGNEKGRGATPGPSAARQGASVTGSDGS
jgi:hypothetical protein